MILTINTSHPEVIELSLLQGKEKLAVITVPARHRQAELLLPQLEKLLKKTKAKLSDIQSIKVSTKGQGFTSLRIGVITANALAYALDIPVRPKEGKPIKIGKVTIATPVYDKPPSITRKKT